MLTFFMKIFIGLHRVFMEHLDCTPIGHCHMDLSEVFIKKFIGVLVKLQLVKAK